MRSSRVAAVSRLLWKGQARECSFANTMVKRGPTMITVEPVNPNKPLGDMGIKKQGAWRYPGNVVQRAPSTLLGSQHYYDDKNPSEARRKHESNFFITINTNRCIGEHLVSPEAAAHGKEAMRRTLNILAQDALLCQYLKFGPKSAWYQKDKFDDVITNIEWQAAVETGENNERLHCHIWLTVHHYSQVQVNMPLMQRLFKTTYNAQLSAEHKPKLECSKMPYISVKLLPTADWAIVMKQYIHKGMTFSQPN